MEVRTGGVIGRLREQLRGLIELLRIALPNLHMLPVADLHISRREPSAERLCGKAR